MLLVVFIVIRGGEEEVGGVCWIKKEGGGREGEDRSRGERTFGFGG